MRASKDKQPNQVAKGSASGIAVYCAFDEIVDAATLIPNPRNPNRHSDEQIRLLAKIIKHQGWRAPITVSNRSGFIVRGHGRLMAANKLKADQVPIDRQDYATEAEEWADLLADNRLSELSETDNPALKDLLEACDSGILEQLGADIELTGYTEAAMADLMSQFHVDGDVTEDEPPEPPKVAVTRTGDLWLCGKHRVLCGDSTKAEDVARLMGGEKLKVIVTDPPYGLDVEGVTNDSHEQFTDLISKWWECITPLVADSAIAAVFQGTRTFPHCLNTGVAAGWGFARYLAMYKRNDRSFPWRGWLLISEAILVFEKGKPNWPHVPSGDYSHDTYCIERQGRVRARAPQDIESQNFPIKPMEVVADLIAKTTKPNEAFLDSFLGSGTALVAAEQLGRRAYGLECQGAYVDVSIRRWAALTGKEPILEETGETFAQVAQERGVAIEVTSPPSPATKRTSKAQGGKAANVGAV